jgi:hypothetical protein
MGAPSIAISVPGCPHFLLPVQTNTRKLALVESVETIATEKEFVMFVGVLRTSTRFDIRRMLLQID